MEEEKVPLTEEGFAEIQQKLNDDPALAEAFAADPGATLASLGYYVTEEVWEQISDTIRLGVAAVVDDVREQIPEGKGKATTITVSLPEVPGN